jgi:delta 1-pyrroline-5-carboxylate dehydrogenase
MTVSLDVREPTWAAFEAACEALGQHPDDVLAGSEAAPAASAPARVVQPGQAEALLGALLEEPFEEAAAPEALDDLKAAQLAWGAFHSSVQAHALRAMARTKRHADRCGVWGVMQRQAGGGPSLARVLASMDPTDAQALREMPLEEMLSFFGLRGVSEISDNLDEYL